MIMDFGGEGGGTKASVAGQTARPFYYTTNSLYVYPNCPGLEHSSELCRYIGIGADLLHVQ